MTKKKLSYDKNRVNLISVQLNTHQDVTTNNTEHHRKASGGLQEFWVSTLQQKTRQKWVLVAVFPISYITLVMAGAAKTSKIFGRICLISLNYVYCSFASSGEAPGTVVWDWL